MDEVFGDSTGLAQKDIERQHEIQRRLGMTEANERSSGSLYQETDKQGWKINEHLGSGLSDSESQLRTPTCISLDLSSYICQSHLISVISGVGTWDII